MAERLTDADVKGLAKPAAGNRITYDTGDGSVRGFGVRVTSAGAKAFVLNYRADGRERRITIGSWPDWTVKAARDYAKGLKRRVDDGGDPMADRHEARAAKTVAELCDYFKDQHLPSRRATTREDYLSIMRLYIRPKLGKLKIRAVRPAEVAALHREIARRAPYRANRMLAVLSTMMNAAIKEGWISENPCKGVEKAQEDRRERFLTPGEITRLSAALATHHEKASANAIRLLLLTGARRGEVLSATWDQFDLEAGVWTKPRASTKQKKDHRLPLSAPAKQLLTEIRQSVPADCRYVFPSSRTSHRGKDGSAATYEPLTEIKRIWASVCKTAGIEGVRLHDLRHTHASILASLGLSLPIIGALLGHTQPSTTARYAHLLDDPLRAATERVGALVSGAGEPADVVPLFPRRTGA